MITNCDSQSSYLNNNKNDDVAREGKFSKLGLSNYSGWLVNEVLVTTMIIIVITIITAIVIATIIIIITIIIFSEQVVNLCKANNWIKPTVYQVLKMKMMIMIARIAKTWNTQYKPSKVYLIGCQTDYCCNTATLGLRSAFEGHDRC